MAWGIGANNDNWLLDGIPGVPDVRANNPNHTAIFPDDANITGTTNVSTNDDVTVNRIEFNNSTNNYLVSGGGSVNLGATTAGAPVNPSVHASGSHEFKTIVNLQADTNVNVASSSTLTFDGALNLGNSTLTKTGSGTMVISNDLATVGGVLSVVEGRVSGNGTVTGDVDNSSGIVAPGNSPGILSMSGNYTQGAAATLEIEVDGDAGPGEDGHDQLAVGGTASLDGTLDIQTDSSFMPAVGAMPGMIGDTFVILTAASRSGEFSTVNGRHVGAGKFYLVQYSPTNVTLGAFQALEGDADGDKDVDITDFNTLSQNFAPSGAPGADWTTGDFDLDGDIDITDFNSLSSNFSPGGYGGDGPSQVPEPASWCLALLALVIGAGVLHRRR